VNESLPGRIFISYRRQETAWPAGRLYDVLVEHFPAEQVFKDVDSIEPGDEFVERITAAVGSCDVLLALIGPQWLTMTDENGQRRLDNPEDYVRLEIETALTRKIRVIPILVDDARIPRANELPATLAPLVRRNAVEISPLTFDTKRLISTVQKTLAEVKVSDTTTGSATPTSTSEVDRANQQVAAPDVEQLYDQALAAYWTQQWDQAVDLLSQVLSRQPDYADAPRKLELARRQQQLTNYYAQASAAADAGDWEQAVAKYTMIADADPDYRDTNARLANARHQQQLASLLAEAHRLHRAGQWAAVIKIGEQLQAIDPAAADRLITSARAELAADQQAAKLAADYHTGLRLIDAGRWTEAVEALERVTRLDSTYQNAPALMDRARLELEQATAEQDRRQAEEHTQRPPRPPDHGEQTRKARTTSTPPPAPATPSADRPPADQSKSPDKQSERLSLRARILVVFLTVVAVTILILLASSFQ
jgi:tetratricopeptide (TPR) repeat protein